MSENELIRVIADLKRRTESVANSRSFLYSKDLKLIALSKGILTILLLEKELKNVRKTKKSRN